MTPFRSTLLLALFAAPATAQVIGIDDLDPATGAVNAFPFNSSTTGLTSLHVYTAAALQARGVCAGATLLDVAVAPAYTSTSGTYNAPQAIITLGHLSVSPPVPGAWTTHLASPNTIHDIAAGPYSFPWQLDTYCSLPGFAAAGFVWDGVRDIGIQFAFNTGMTGTFTSHRCNNMPRHHQGSVFNATTQLPTSTAAFATELRLTFAPGAGCAVRTKIGTGCYDKNETFYESFVNLQSFDLAGTIASPVVVQATKVIGGHVVDSGAPAWFTPTGTQLLTNSTLVAMGDNSMSTGCALPFAFPVLGGTVGTLHAGSDGYIVLGSTTSTSSDSSPTALELRYTQASICPLWCDLSPAINVPTNPASGVYFDVDPSGQTVYVTWLDCADARGTNPAAGVTSVNVQCAIHASGSFEFRYGHVVPNANAGGVIVGWSPGNSAGYAAGDPGSIDISASMPFNALGPDRALDLDSNTPRLGTNFVMTTRFVPYDTPFAFLSFGSLPIPEPGVDLGFLGAPNCRLYHTPDLTVLGFPVASGTGSVTLGVPNSTGLIGASLAAQSVALTIDNSFGLALSNGLEFIVGN